MHPQSMTIIGTAPRAGIKPTPTSVSVLNDYIFCRGGVYPLPNQKVIFYVTRPRPRAAAGMLKEDFIIGCTIQILDRTGGK